MCARINEVNTIPSGVIVIQMLECSYTLTTEAQASPVSHLRIVATVSLLLSTTESRVRAWGLASGMTKTRVH